MDYAAMAKALKKEREMLWEQHYEINPVARMMAEFMFRFKQGISFRMMMGSPTIK